MDNVEMEKLLNRLLNRVQKLEHDMERIGEETGLFYTEEDK